MSEPTIGSYELPFPTQRFMNLMAREAGGAALEMIGEDVREHIDASTTVTGFGNMRRNIRWAILEHTRGWNKS